MKRLIMFFAVVAMLAPAVAVAQATIKNESSRKIIIWSTDYVFQFVIDPGGKVFANDKFTPSDGEVTFLLYVREGQDRENLVGRITKKVENGKFSIDNNDTDGKATAQKEAQPVVETASEVTTAAAAVINQTKPMMLSITNSSEYKFYFLDGPCAGLALEPGATSVTQYSFYMGQIELTVKHKNAKEPKESDKATTKDGKTAAADSAKKNGAGGKDRNYSQKVVSTIITEGQKELTISNSDLSVTAGAPAIRTFLKSVIPYKIVFVGGPFKGALRYNSFTKKADMDEGFNSLAIQFVGSDGQKYQADLEIIVTKFDRPLILREVDVKHKRVIKTR